MRISTQDWKAYISRLSALSRKAAEEMQEFVRRNGFAETDRLIDFAYGLATKYGEGAAALSCQFYDAIAFLQNAAVPPAVPAATASYHEVAKTVVGVRNQSENVEMMGGSVGRLVKQAGADTTLLNAKRDGAEVAWIPNGDTCAFCLTLASNGWQHASRKTLKGSHAEHIHANCDCTYAIRFDSSTNVSGYDPKRYLRMYENAEGTRPEDKINSLRRQFYAENKEKILAQKADALEKRRELNSSFAEEFKA